MKKEKQKNQKLKIEYDDNGNISGLYAECYGNFCIPAEYTKLEGEFKVSTEDASILLAAFNPKSVTSFYRYGGGQFSGTEAYFFGSESSIREEFKRTLDNYKTDFEAEASLAESRLHRLEKSNDRLECLLRIFKKMPRFIKKLFISKSDMKDLIYQFNNEL